VVPKQRSSYWDEAHHTGQIAWPGRLHGMCQRVHIHPGRELIA
jgi:hypothetical protein